LQIGKQRRKAWKVNFSRATVVLAALCLWTGTATADLFGGSEKKKKTEESSNKPKSEGDSSKKKGQEEGLLTRMWGKFHHAPAEGAKTVGVERQLGKSRVLLSMSLDPSPVKLSEVRQLKVTLRVANAQKKMVQLEFPTTQRIEVLVKDKVGKMVEQWSEDRTFASEPGMVSINPGEHLEYSATVSTRDMVAGQTYTVEALFPNYESLRLQQDVVAEK